MSIPWPRPSNPVNRSVNPPEPILLPFFPVRILVQGRTSEQQPMTTQQTEHSGPQWLADWMSRQDILLWGGADLRTLNEPVEQGGQRFPFAIAWAAPMQPQIMASISNGPNQAYADEYARINTRINRLSEALADALVTRGYHALALAASKRTDPVEIRGDFPHKTAATLAGLGWIGRNCQLITRPYGPWVRLGTVFTDLALPCGPPMQRSFCGQCRLCVQACPAKALLGKSWTPETPREALLHVETCDLWKKKHYFAFHNGHNCGICAAVCPYGTRTLRNKPLI
jgi:epoxyqueuosine reductase